MDQLLCIDRKREDQESKARQLAFVQRFASGTNGIVVSGEKANQYPVSHPWLIRGMKFTTAVQECWRTERTFFYIDNGYFGNLRTKTWFRIIKNHVHDIRDIIERPRDRLDLSDIVLKPRSTGKKILIAPPSEKSLSLWNMNPQVWVDATVAELSKHTDRPVEIRLKRPRTERLKENTMEEALADDVHCLVTYNSVAAVEAVMLGKPAIVLGPNAAHSVCSQSLDQVENPFFPDEDLREAWLRHLSYSQFTFVEMADGTAYHMLNEG